MQEKSSTNQKSYHHFSEAETDHLIVLVGIEKIVLFFMLYIKSKEKNYEIINNKKTDSNNNVAKEKAWLDILEKHNKIFAGRSLTQIKDKWRYLTRNAKVTSQMHRRDKFKTGGGNSEVLPVSEESEKVLQIISKDIAPLRNKFDGDSKADSDIEIVETLPQKKTKLDQKFLNSKILEMKQAEHEARMEVIQLEKTFWQNELKNQRIKHSSVNEATEDDLYLKNLL